MKFRVLGCSGGVGGGARTTSFLLDSDILIDAGTGVYDLSVAEMAAVDHVFLTHSHLDHIAALPMLVDSVGAIRSHPVVVHALPETIAALRAHIFNWVIWPDFTEIPHYERPWMVFEPLAIDSVIEIAGRKLRSLPASHTVPALAFQIYTDDAALVFSGDTGPNDDFWRAVNGVANLRYLIVENAFANKERDLAVTAKHLFPIQLGEELAKLQLEPEVLITHLKPSDRELIATEVGVWAGRFAPRVLVQGEVLEL